MDPRSFGFIESVLGPDGAGALAKAAERSSELAAAILPRTVLAWLRSEDEYEGEVPGVSGTSVTFAKSESGFTGSVVIGNDTHAFENASLFHVAAAVAVAINSDHGEGLSELRDLDIDRLGKSIDVLARQKMIGRELAKAKDESDDRECSICAEEKNHGNHGGDGMKAWYKPVHEYKPHKVKWDRHLEKAKVGPGRAAGAIAPKAPEAPTANQPPLTAAALKPKLPVVSMPLPKPPKVASVKMTRSEASRPCSLCGGAQFRGENFVGCSCVRELAKNIVAVSTPTGFDLKLTGLERDELFTVFEVLGKI